MRWATSAGRRDPLDQTEEVESQGNARLDLAAVLTSAGRPQEAAAAYVEALDLFERKGATTLLPDMRGRLVAPRGRRLRRSVIARR